MSAAVGAELRKILSTRLWWVLLLGLTGYMAFLAGVLTLAFTAPESIGGQGDGGGGFGLDPSAVATSIYTLPASTGYVFPLVIGTLTVTSEFRYQTITTTFLAEPRRGVVLAAKMVAGLVVGLGHGLVATVATAAVGASVLTATGEPARLGEAATQRTLGLTVLTMGVWALVGVGFGALLTNQVASVIVVLGFTQFVEPIGRLLLMTNASTAGVSRFLPGAAGEALAGGGLFGGASLVDPLTWWQGGLVLLGYAVLMAAIGWTTSLQRDIT